MCYGDFNEWTQSKRQTLDLRQVFKCISIYEVLFNVPYELACWVQLKVYLEEMIPLIDCLMKTSE